METREHHAAHLLEQHLGFRVEFRGDAPFYTLYCFKGDGQEPVAIISRNRNPGSGYPAWGAIAPADLQLSILKLLNTGGV